MTKRIFSDLLSFVMLMALLWGSSCQSGSQEQNEQASETPAPAAPAAPNTLTDAEKAEGWTLLFDGKTLNGWHSYLRESAEGWTVEDGSISVVGGGGDLVTDDNYRNFDLRLEWKISPAGNSGIIYRVIEDPKYGQTYATGPEYQVLDDLGFPQELKPSQYAGSNYDMHAPSTKAVKPAGEWNQTRILVNGNHVEHWLNGKKVVEYELGSENWKLRMETSKWKDFPGYGTGETGKIALQYHDHPVWYRDIKIKVL